MKGVFEISGSSRYDDLIDERYHFPKMYLQAAQQCVGDWILYRETGSAGGRMAYVAVARVVAIDPDPADRNLFYARIRDFLPLDRHVPYRDASGRFAEQFLRDLDNPAFAGRALRGRSVRLLTGQDFAAIVDQGLEAVLDPANAIRLELDGYHLDANAFGGLGEQPTERQIEQILVNRKVRDAAFRKAVLDAYENTCAVTGLRIINGGGKAEAQAAHIWSVADGGPDIVQNGIALSATAHWLFDRHLISLTDDFQLLVSHNKVPTELRTLFPVIGQPIRLPKNQHDRPRLEYVTRHRERFAAGWL
jgi:putative restriction endonuclease